MAYNRREWLLNVAKIAFFRSLVDLLNRHYWVIIRKNLIIGIALCQY